MRMIPERLLWCLLLVGSLAFPQFALGQPAQATEFYRKGEEALLEKNFKKAIRAFEQALRIQPDLVAAERGIGLSYALLNDYPKALEHYQVIIEKAPRFSRVLYYQTAELYYKLGLYSRALAYFQQFERLQQVDLVNFTVNGEREQELERELLAKLPGTMQACQVSLDTTKLRQQADIRNLGGAINTDSDEYFPFVTNDQALLFYTRRRRPGDDENLYYSRLHNGYWQNGSPVGNPFNTNQNEGMSTLVRDGRTMYFTACNRPEVKGPCDIWSATVVGHKITSIIPLPDNPNSEGWESQACISCDGRLLYFSSNRPGGLGGTDIWVSTQQRDGSWSEPENLGSQVNTDQDEESPFITNDGKTLFFSSTGHLGFGQQDVFMSVQNDDGSWSTAFNLGPKINSPFDELGFILTADGKNGYFASDRPNGFGGLDIYQVSLQEQLRGEAITFVEGFVLDSVTEAPIMTPVLVDGRGFVPTDSTGRFFLCMHANSELPVTVKIASYHPYQQTFTIPPWDNRQFYTVELRLSPIVKYVPPPPPPEPPPPDTLDPLRSNRFKQLNRYYHTLYFQFDSDKLELGEQDKFQAFINSLSGKDIQRVEINGYADDIGEDKYNLLLSELRAKKIALVFMEQGIAVSRIAMKGNGELRDDKPKRQNRRVEIKITTLE